MQDHIKKDLIENYDKHPKRYFAEKYNVRTSTVFCWGTELGITRNKKWEDHKEDILRDYNNGLSIIKIAKKYRHDQTNTKKFLENNGCYIRDSSESHRIFNVNENYFEKIDSHKKAYWLGFIYGDGNIHENKLQIGLDKKDKDLLIDILKDLESNHKLYNDRGNPKLVIRSFKMIDDLKRLGVTPNKSLSLIPPTEQQLPKKYERAFILGLFDADGCLSKGQVSKKGNTIGQMFSIVGTKSMLEWVKERMPDFNLHINLEKRCKHGKTWNLINSLTKENVKKMRDWLYKDFDFGLERKRKKFNYNG